MIREPNMNKYLDSLNVKPKEGPIMAPADKPTYNQIKNVVEELKNQQNHRDSEEEEKKLSDSKEKQKKSGYLNGSNVQKE